MADLKGGTTIGGYLALHSGMSNAYIGGNLTVSGTIVGAVYNDYAEYRQSKEQIAGGRVACEAEGRYIRLSSRRLEKAPMIVSDVFGFCVGKQTIEGEYSLPVSVAGRVLAYTDKPRAKFKTGDAVCSGKGGTVSKMRWWEKIIYPDRILGVVSEIPSYSIWGSNHVAVGERIWIKIS